jgi:HD domain-containing protein
MCQEVNMGRSTLASGVQFPVRDLAGVSVPDTPLVFRAIEHARQHSEPYLFNHVMRSWLFAVSLAQLDGTPHDAEALAVATVLHDVGLSIGSEGPLRFEVEGANAAREFAREAGLDDRRAQLIWDSVALNSTPSIAYYKEREVALCSAGTVLDWSGQGSDRLTNDQMAAILEAFPRLGMKQRFTQAVCRIVERRPGTTYDNFARDFGERFVAGYKAPSTVDYLLKSPFGE